MELGSAASASAAQIGRLVQVGKNTFALQLPRLRSEAESALAVLGEGLHKAGLGDAELRAQLTAVNERIVSLATAKASTRTTVAVQVGLPPPRRAVLEPTAADGFRRPSAAGGGGPPKLCRSTQRRLLRPSPGLTPGDPARADRRRSRAGR